MSATNPTATAALALERRLNRSSPSHDRIAGRARLPQIFATCGLLRNRNYRLARTYIFEVVVGAYCNGVFARFQIAQRKFIGLLFAIADSGFGRDDRPVAAVQAVLRAIDA